MLGTNVFMPITTQGQCIALWKEECHHSFTSLVNV